MHCTLDRPVLDKGIKPSRGTGVAGLGNYKMDGIQPQPSEVEGSNTIEQYGAVLRRVMAERGENTSVLARKIKVDRSLLCRVRNGTRSITPQLVNSLIEALDLDRERLALAVLIMGKSDYYFDPRFRNACYVLVKLLNTAMDRPADESASRALTNLSKTNCEKVAIKAIEELIARFSTPEGVRDLAAKLFNRPD